MQRVVRLMASNCDNDLRRSREIRWKNSTGASWSLVQVQSVCALLKCVWRVHFILCWCISVCVCVSETQRQSAQSLHYKDNISCHIWFTVWRGREEREGEDGRRWRRSSTENQTETQWIKYKTSLNIKLGPSNHILKNFLSFCFFEISVQCVSVRLSLTGLTLCVMYAHTGQRVSVELQLDWLISVFMSHCPKLNIHFTMTENKPAANENNESISWFYSSWATV